MILVQQILGTVMLISKHASQAPELLVASSLVNGKTNDFRRGGYQTLSHHLALTCNLAARAVVLNSHDKAVSY